MRLWINAGELSGDMQAAALLNALKARAPDLQAVGMGGPHLAAAGQENLLRVEALSVMGVTEILSALPRALCMLSRIRRELRARRPDAVLLVDAPEFNFRVACIANDLNIPVLYFIPPKVWAWRTGRVEFLRRHIRKLYCILPFEPAFYARHGLDVDYVGNPLVDMVNWPSLAGIPPEPARLGLMPGSRNKEIRALLPRFAAAVRLLRLRHPELETHCLRAPGISETALRALWPDDVPMTVQPPEQRYRFMRSCTVMLAASGTATLECALAGVPTVVAYRVAPFSAFVGRRLIRVPWVSLPNLILDEEVFPELLQNKATPDAMAERLHLWLAQPSLRQAVCQRLDAVRERCGPPGSADRAAAALLRDLENSRQEAQP